MDFCMHLGQGKMVPSVDRRQSWPLLKSLKAWVCAKGLTKLEGFIPDIPSLVCVCACVFVSGD